ncbi:MAG: putative ATP-dependent endonuclease of the family [Clostridium butyricum]|nr:putative ATP-dependent endonuclease of the family [Clostridium butyricum]
MLIKRIIIKNYKCLYDFKIEFNEKLNIIVGNNEVGKSTLLEAINLALSGKINGVNIQYEMSPYIFNNNAVKKYIDTLKSGKYVEPPKILIEVYLEENPETEILIGTNNSLRENSPGVFMLIEFDDRYYEEYKNYIKNPSEVKTIPVEYYTVKWYSFAYNSITSRSIPVNVTLIDTTLFKLQNSADKYIAKIIDDVLSSEERANLALAFRELKEQFSEKESVKNINKKLIEKKGEISEKELSISFDISSRANWESNLIPYLDGIPFSNIGKGEQNSIKMKLALEAKASESHVLLIEEPECHLSFSNMNKLINAISNKCYDKQLIITTHSAFVLNKLGLSGLILINNGVMTLKDLSIETQEYFKKLPGYDTLRMILAKKAILVEGPSDELIVQKAYKIKYNKLPIEDGIDVISVRALAFKRFLEIAKFLKIDVCVITDNDGNIKELEKKYKEFSGEPNIKIYYDKDEKYPTLEPQLVKSNGIDILNKIFEKDFDNEDDLIDYMIKNKTECALKIFETDENIKIPRYIEDAIKK